MNPSLHKSPLFILPSFSAGGAERVLITLMNGLDHAQYAPQFISLRRDGPLKNLIADNIPIHAPFNFAKVVFALPYLWWKIITLKPDMVISTMAHMNFAVLLLRPVVPRRTKMIVREAITASYIFDMMPNAKFVAWLYRWLYPRAARVICPAQIVIDEFKTLIGVNTDKFVRLYNPVDIAKITAHTTPPNTDSKMRFVAVGRLHVQKGFDQLITALAAATLPFDWTLNIIGEGTEHAALSALITQYNLTDKITLTGFQSNPWADMSAADALLLPSRHEGLPNVALESLTLGTPVIALHTAGGINEIAELSEHGAVMVTNNMGEFITAMSRTTKKTSQKNLLPEIFYPETVKRRFADILGS